MKVLFSRTPIFRMAQIRRRLLRGDLFTAETLARELEADAKTIHRDIDFMREHLNYEISFNFEQRSYVGQPSVITTL
jgi:hypothetical protein